MVNGGLTQLWTGTGALLGARRVGLYIPPLYSSPLVGLFTCPRRLLYDNGLLSAFMQPLAARGLRR